MEGRCSCGKVVVTIPRAPDYINFCNCSLCRRTGGAFGYFDKGEVSVTGEMTDFVRSDLEEVFLSNRFCPNCGTSVMWVPLPNYETQRVGVNMRLFDPEELKGIECRFPDGIHWTDATPGQRHPPQSYGAGIVF